MSKCSYCERDAGWFKHEHSECAKRHRDGLALIKEAVKAAVILGKQYSDIQADISSVAASHFVIGDKLNAQIIDGFSEAAEDLATQGSVDSDTFNAIHEFGVSIGLTSMEMAKTTGVLAAMHAVLLWGVVNGCPISAREEIGFNLDDGEKLIIQNNAVYLIDSLERSRRGTGDGFSIPLGHGIRYHIGGFESHPVEMQKLKQVDRGMLCLTTKNLHFQGQHKAFSLPYKKILSVRPYSEGIGLFRKRVDAKQEIFLTGTNTPYATETTFKILQFLTSQEGRDLYKN